MESHQPDRRGALAHLDDPFSVIGMACSLDQASFDRPCPARCDDGLTDRPLGLDLPWDPKALFRSQKNYAKFFRFSVTSNL